MKKIILTLIALFIIFVGITVVFLVTSVKQNTIKNKIVQLVHDKTGRELTIKGRIQWSFFPWLGIKIQDVTLNNTVEFKASTFAQAGKVDISVKLLPLIAGRIEGDCVKLKNFSIWLMKDNQGLGNWQDLLIANNSNTSRSRPADKNSSALKKFTINNIQIDNGSVFWLNQQTNKKFVIKNLNLYGKDINFAESFAVRGNFHWQIPDTILLNGETKIDVRIKLDPVNKIYELQNLQLAGAANQKNLSQPVDFVGKTNIIVDLNKQNLIAKEFKLHATNAVTTVLLQGNDILITPKLVKLPTIKAELDDMVLCGNAHYSWVDSDNLEFNFTLNKLDVATLTKAIMATVAPVANNNVTAQLPVKNAGDSHSSFGVLRKMKVLGDLKIGALQIKKLNFNALSTKINGENGVINCQNISSDFYHGSMHGDAVIDLSNVAPQLNLKLKFAEVAMQPLLMDVAAYDKFSGILALDANINMSSITSTAMLNSLSGMGNVFITNGAYHGVDIPYEVRRAHAILNQKKIPQKPQRPMTNFDQLTASFNIVNSLLSTNDFLIQSSDYKVTGQGSANLASQLLDLQLSAYSTHDENFFVPIKILGSFTQPSIKPDVAVMVQRVVEKTAKKQVKKQLQKLSIPSELIDVLPLH